MCAPPSSIQIINFHQLNIANDYTQEYFLRGIGVENPNVHERINKAHAYINAKVPNFRTFTIGGRAENIIGGYFDGFLNESLGEQRQTICC